MSSFDFVTERLATGGALSTPADIDQLVSVGITAIIDCRSDFDDQSLVMAHHSDLMYLWNGVEDDGEPKPPEWFQRSWRFAMPLFVTPWHKIYCHCQAGVNRGPSTAYAILRALGMSKLLAHGVIVEARPQCAVGLRYAEDADRALVLGW